MRKPLSCADAKGEDRGKHVQRVLRILKSRPPIAPALAWPLPCNLWSKTPPTRQRSPHDDIPPTAAPRCRRPRADGRDLGPVRRLGGARCRGAGHDGRLVRPRPPPPGAEPAVGAARGVAADECVAGARECGHRGHGVRHRCGRHPRRPDRRAQPLLPGGARRIRAARRAARGLGAAHPRLHPGRADRADGGRAVLPVGPAPAAPHRRAGRSGAAGRGPAGPRGGGRCPPRRHRSGPGSLRLAGPVTPPAPVDRAAAAQLWAGYAAARPEAVTVGDEYTVDRFGDSAELADELLGLVLHGPKRATAALIADFAAEGQPLPRIGSHWVACDGAGTPRAVLRTVELRIGPVDSVDDAFAYDEGEDDRTRDSWLRGHTRCFRRVCAARGETWTDQHEVVFERFRLVWPPDVAD